MNNINLSFELYCIIQVLTKLEYDVFYIRKLYNIKLNLTYLTSIYVFEHNFMI